MKLSYPKNYINDIIAIASRDIKEVGFANLESILHEQPEGLRKWYIIAVAKKMVSSGKYIESILDNKIIITKNPSYVNKVLYKIKEQVIAGIVALIVTILTIVISNRLQHQKYKELNRRMDSVEHRLNLQANPK